VRTIIVAFALLMSISFSIAKEDMLYQGEELLYEVSFFGVKLGSIKILTESGLKLAGKDVVKVKGLLNSYKGIPFVDLASVFESWLDPSATYSYKFTGNVKTNNDRSKQEINFDYEKGIIKNKQFKNNELEFNNTISTNKKWSEGLSLLFLARKFANLKRTIKIPTIIYKDTCSTTINFTGKQENISISAFKKPIKTLYFTGIADWEGIYGLSGKFEGWFSDDDAHVPIKAKMNVYVGNVVIELKQWKRGTWNPPS
jgi:hypothetical protein